MYKDNKTIVAEAIADLENTFCGILETVQASEMHDAALFLLTGGKENELTERNRKAMYHTIQLINAIQKVQLVHSIERCMVKVI